MTGIKRGHLPTPIGWGAIAAFLLFAPALPAIAQGRFDRPTFFRDGQQQLDREIQNLQQTPDPSAPPTTTGEASPLLTVKSGQLSWQKYLFRDGGFSVWMPAGVQSQETLSLTTTQGELSFTVFATQPPNYRFIAAYSNPVADSPATPAQRLSAIARGIAEKTQFSIVSDDPLGDRPYPARRLVLQNEQETLVFEIYVIGQRVYVLAVGQQKQPSPSVAATSFFDSFRLLP